MTEQLTQSGQRADLAEILPFSWVGERPVAALAAGAQITFTSSSDDKQTGRDQ